jgi:acrylyl-CoA reductase (NADPH)
MGFRAIVVDRDAAGRTEAGVRELELGDLPEGEVTVAVEYSTLNYKDGLCLGPGAGLVRRYPHVPGIDFAGRVEASEDPRYRPGDAVVLTGWRVGEAHWGGYAGKARVKADWLVPLPEGLTLRQSMAIGTAGLTAMLAVMTLEERGLRPGHGPVLVTGAAGGVGSVAVAVLARLGHEVAAVTGRPESEGYLKGLGAARIVPREELAAPAERALESETWAGCVDAVGGAVLARVTKQLKYRAAAAAVGNAGGADVPLSIIPFLLRGVSLLGVDSVLQPFESRQRAWGRLVRDLDLGLLESMVRPAVLADVPALGAEILKGRVQGRVVVDVGG